ncbi:unnamed protein product [Parascedosporium putredinis]|uniref:Uncharacterized protein n=1 Tax=Parascedosporium putredinis TaxID=1442378 RepID=A0A9P1GZ22_9PEZI|nr:unnamed protein product [Parascedosporium putredinis]CAI7991218.1 unnamed protein product [Parascedosporium putredinis]
MDMNKTNRQARRVSRRESKGYLSQDVAPRPLPPPLLPSALAASSLLVSHFEGTLYSLALDDAASSLTISGQVSTGGGMPSWLTLDREAGKVYVTDEACCLYGGSDGKAFIAAAQYNGGALINYKLPISPSSPTPIQHLKYTMSGPGPKPDRQDAPTSTPPSPTPAAASSSPPTSAPTSDINVLYTVNELGNSVTSWSVAYPAAGGCLTLTRGKTIATLPAGKNPPAGSKASEIRVRDNFIYASNRFDKSFGQNEDSIATYEIDPATGEFSFTSSNVAIVERDPATGRLGGLLANLVVGRPGAEMNEDGLSAVIWNE